MNLFLLRHGVAEQRRTSLPDPERPLTEAGAAEIRDMADGLVARNFRLDVLFTSPYARSLQTAEILCEKLQLPSVTVDPALASGSLCMSVLRDLVAGQPANARIMIVGHEPDLSLLAGRLLGGARIELKKGGLIRIETPKIKDGEGILRWVLTPGHLICK